MALGEVVADADGSFAGSLPMPAGIDPGDYTLQVNGFSPDFSVRSLNLGVTVQASATRTWTARVTVKFAGNTLALTPSAKVVLRRLAVQAKSGAEVVQTTVVGGAGSKLTAQERRRSLAQARLVADYLRSLGLRGKYVIRGTGESRETSVKVTYRS